jgi:hypothetical protein
VISLIYVASISLSTCLFKITRKTCKMPNSPLFVRTDSDLSDSSSDDFDERLCRASDDFDFDKDNDTIKDFEQGEVDGQPLSHVNSDIVISDGTETVNFNFSSKSPEPYSSDPFAINYRKTADWDEATKAKFQKEYWFIPDVLEKYQSVEHAEFTRPFDQFRVLLQVRTFPPTKMIMTNGFDRNVVFSMNTVGCLPHQMKPLGHAWS